MARAEFIAGLDIGTTKIVCCLGRMEEEGQLQVLGYGFAEGARGFKGGAVVDLARLVDSISESVEKAEEKAKRRIHTVFVNLAGPYVKGHTTKGVVTISHREDEITGKDLERLTSQVRSVATPYDEEVIHLIPQAYNVDGQVGIENPLGMYGSKLEGEYYIITGLSSLIQNLTKAVNLAGLEVEGFALSGLASSFSALTELEKNLGVILIDVGGSVTEAITFVDGFARFSQAIPLGGDQLTEAISTSLKIPFHNAQRLKEKFGSIYAQGQRDLQERIMIEETVPPRSMPMEKLLQIIEPKMKDIFVSIKKYVNRSPYTQKVSSGIVFIGGCSRMDGVLEMAESIFNCPVRIGRPRGLTGEFSHLASPQYVTSLGLINYGFQERHKSRATRLLGQNPIAKIVSAARTFLSDYF